MDLLMDLFMDLLMDLWMDVSTAQRWVVVGDVFLLRLRLNHR
jgi:hypothetical protein